MTRDAVVFAAQDVIRKGSKSFRAASQLFDRETREKAWLLYSWCRHCDDVCDGQILGMGRTDRGSVAMLRAKTADAIAGRPADELPFQALAQLLSECPVPIRYLDDHLDGFALDEAGWSPRSEEELIRYCYHVAGTVGAMMAVVMGVPPQDGETLERAADLGIAFQLSNIVRDIREDAEAGRCYLPSDWLAEFGLTRETLFLPENAKALETVIGRMVERIAEYERRARPGVRKLPFRSRLAVLAALRIYGAIGRKVERLGPAAWDRRVSVGRLRKLAYLLPSFAEAVVIGRR